MPPQTVDKRTFLSAHPFFKGLEPELIDQVGSHAITRVVKAGTVIQCRLAKYSTRYHCES